MTYNEVLNYIKEKEKIGSVFGLDSIKELLRRLGNPEQGIPAIHIAGTNGKGSILAYVEEALIGAGLKVGRYISPTIFDYRERFRLNKSWASEEDTADAVTEVSLKVEEMIADGLNSPTAFEIETAVTFLLFKKWDVDVMLIECGMGGLLDATNVIESDVINVLAAISLDHMQVLGDTVQEITMQKLGIVRQGALLVSYPQTEEVNEVIDFYVEDNSVRLIASDAGKLEIISEDIKGSEFRYKGKDYRISMGGDYQIRNAITAIDVLETYFKEFGKKSNGTDILDTDTDISEMVYAHIRKGLELTRWEGRFTVFEKNPTIIVDGAHNYDAWIKLRESLNSLFPEKKFVYIIGVLADKEYKKMVDILGLTAEKVYCVESDSPRALKADELAEEFKQGGTSAESYLRDYEGAIKNAMGEAIKMDTIVVICGTLSITGEMIKCIELIK